MKRWEVWLIDEHQREADFQQFINEKKIINESSPKNIILGHLDKTDHNLKFCLTVMKLKEYNDWAVVSAYYAIYHASLALCALKGYSTKNHNATLLVIIKEYYMDGLDMDHIQTACEACIEKEEVLYYVEAKSERHKASYTNNAFQKAQAEMLRLKAIAYVNKVKKIISTNV